MKKSRAILESNLIQVLDQTELRKFKDKVEDISDKLLANHDMTNVQGIFNNPEERIPELDIRELMLFCEQVYFKTGVDVIEPEEFFHQSEIDDARQFSEHTQSIDQTTEYPIVIENVSVLGNSAYQIVLDIKDINKLLNSGILYYDPELQRETTMVKRQNIVIKQPTIVMKNVEEIAKHMIEGTLVPTNLVLNAMPRTATHGDELIFDAKKRTLTITNGTKIAIVDGMHRITGGQNALTVDPELSFNFSIILTNYNKKRAQQYQAQLAKATPISKVRIQELEANRLSDTVVQILKEESELKGRISSKSRPFIEHGELVAYSVLSDTIDEEFDLQKRIDAEDVGEYLTDFFNYLIGKNEEEFITNAQKVNKDSLINSNVMFIGYIALARVMFEKGIKARKIGSFLEQIDFSRSNPIWKEIKLLDEKGRVDNKIYNSDKVKKSLKEIFESINFDGDKVEI
ncbi:DNA sulfur modification protein DndB [Niallia taxi]|uniref:DNA sulfur modification protein DndB n=1 Tax=Niallia taxi TaxID=2499688 RepID=UPI00300BB1A7